jgi:ABC-type transport system involved in multi-copper enzyme maturation permease subunit
MTWVVWRQTRATALGIIGILALYGGLATAESLRPNTFGGITISFTPYLFLFLALLGAPLVSREFELGTDQFAWTQSVTRRRWLVGRLAGMLGVAMLAVAALQATISAVPGGGAVLPGDPRFLVHGPLPYALAAFLVTFGALAGALIRRTLPALGATLLVTVATIGVLTPIPYGSSGWVARYWPAQLALGGTLLALAVAQAAATFRLVEGRR